MILKYLCKFNSQQRSCHEANKAPFNTAYNCWKLNGALVFYRIQVDFSLIMSCVMSLHDSALGICTKLSSDEEEESRFMVLPLY